MSTEQQLKQFVDWWQHVITGYEKGEGQIFLDNLMKAFGHAGALEIGTLEKSVRRKRNGRETVSFADYHIPGKALIEMKKRDEHLAQHYKQLEDYWKNLSGM